MNFRLTIAYSWEEVEITLKQMAPLKSLSPHGFSTCFYQQRWNIIGDEVSRAVLDILQEKGISPSINSTFIALILKNNNHEAISDFRPISLCNVFYKLVSKMIYNRLKSVMPLIISRMQSTFILDRLITDNIMVAY